MKRSFLIAACLFMLAGAIGAQEKPMVYVVPDAHLDTQWNWTVQTTIDQYIYDTMVQNFKLFEQYPDYIFNFEGGVKYAWAKEYYPQLYETLKKYIAEGRWHISGASWDATDWNLPSIESSIRNIMYGQKFYQEEFGIKSTDIMLPDCFGFGWTLPSVANHCGLIGFHTQKLKWRYKPFYDGKDKIPFHFGIWKGIDGASIMAALDGGNYTWSPTEPVAEWAPFLEVLDGSPINAAFRYAGTGDIGGSIAPTGIRYIEDAIRNPGPAYDLKFAASDEMFKKFYMDSRLPSFDGELLMDVHGTGCYTSKVELKNLNRRNEFAIEAAEALSAYASLFGGTAYPQYLIDNSWRRIIWHQFHDDLTGTSIPDAYRFSYNDEYIVRRQMAGVTENAVSDILSLMKTDVKGTAVAVLNNVSAANRSVAEARIQLDDKYVSVDVYSPSGKKVPSQVIRHENGRARVAFAAEDPSMSIGVYDFRPSARKVAASRNLKASATGIENKVYRITLDDNGDIKSIVDKRCGRELVKPGEYFGYDVIDGNRSHAWPSWEILKSTIDRKPERTAGKARVSVEECGPLRAVIKIERSFAGSEYTQRIILTDGASDDRIDVVNDVRWWSPATLLKAAFHFNFDAPAATYDLGMGHISRGNNVETAYEVFGRQWADMTSSDGSYGVTIINDSRYGWDKPDDNTLRLTLLHTPATKDRYVYQNTQDFGVHVFTYSIVGHQGELNPAKADADADCLNIAKETFVTGKHAGGLGRTLSMAGTNNPALRVKALKQAYDGDGMVVRVYEISGKGASGEVRFPYDILSAEELNGIEEPAGPAAFSGKSLKVNSGRFALKTYRVRLASPGVKVERPVYEKVDLDYNTVGITTDEFATQGRIGRDKYSVAAEILPEIVEYKGIPFKFGEPDYNDVMVAKGQTIAVPEGSRTLHLLVAGDSVRDFPAAFRVGDKKVVRKISSFTGFYGQYGWPDFYGSYLKDGDIAYVGTHRHSASHVGNTYRFTYMYLVSIPVEDAERLVLPDDRRVVIFAATAEK